MLCLTILLAFQTPLPEVGSAAAVEADDAYRSWVESLPMPPVTPAHMEYALSASMEASIDGELIEMTLDCDAQVDFQSLQRFRYQISGTAGMTSMGSIAFEGALLFDGKTVWIHGKVHSEDLEIQEQGMVRCDQEVLEDGYLQLMDLLPRMTDNPMVQEIGMESLFLLLTELLPPDIGTYLHPAGYMYYASKSLTCRSLQASGDSLDLDLAIDIRPDSPMGTILRIAEDLDAGGELTDADREEFKMMQVMADKMILHLRQDRATGIPLAMESTFEFDAGMLDLEETGNADFPLKVTMTMLGTMTNPESIEDALFAEPPSYEQTLDVTPFVQMGLQSLHQLVEELESEEDMEF